MTAKPRPIGRLAPSPTGLLHLGNAWSFLLAWLAARSQGGRIILRQEDIDPARSRQEWMDNIVRDLHWLGLDWDEGPDKGGPHGPYQQSLCGERYSRILEDLERRGLVYPCYCTRKELRELAGAPHGAHDGLSDAGAAYPGTCRHLLEEQRMEKEAAGRRASLRLVCPDGEDGRQYFTDLILGPQSITLTQCGGDFALRRSDGVWAYQLAVVADDIAMGVTQIVRGEDILISTPRQLRLYSLLGHDAPAFAHIPLLHDAQGERLAKRHQSLSLAQLRDMGCRPERIVGWLASLAGLNENAAPITAHALAERLSAERDGILWEHLKRCGKLIVPDGIEQAWRN